MMAFHACDCSLRWVGKDHDIPDFHYCPMHAAAPDLLDACKAFVAEAGSLDFEMTPGEREAFDLATAAIAKATGEQP